jgi:hypothetical protein
MRDTAYVPELEEDSSARPVDHVSDASPAGHLLDAVDAWRVGISHTLRGDLRSLGHQEARRGALLIVAGDDRGWHVARPRAIPRHRCHDEPVREAKRSEGIRSVEICAVRCHSWLLR